MSRPPDVRDGVSPTPPTPPMSPERWRAVKAVVEGALGVPPAERGNFLDRACGTEAELRREVEALLAAHDAASGDAFLARPAVEDVGLRDAPDSGAGADLPARLARALGGEYALERELGGGGMSRVFLARDVRLGRRVVVKVLHPDLAVGLSARRFEREVTLAAQLQHPHVLPVHAAGAVDGLPYYTMPYVEGESLRSRLAREGALPIPEAVRLVRELADALAYAHGQGVVHRDLKPENVLLSGGHAVVADFGVAKALATATHAGPATGSTTGLGVAVGTPAYMAPEQTAGDPDTDHRADLYALGVIAYELLAGAHPFAGRAPTAMLAAHLTERPPPLAERRPEVPPAIGGLVARLLAKRPEDRPQSAAEVVRELDAMATPASGASALRPTRLRRRRVFTAVAALVVVVVSVGSAVAAWVTSPDRRGGARAQPVLAVLPFENLGAPADAYFADGLTEVVRARLTGIAELQVIGGASARPYKGTTKAPRQIARELGATHLLTATVRWQRGAGGGRVAVSPELVRAADQTSVWAEPIEGPLGDVFALQARIAERVAASLDLAFHAAGSGADPARRPAPPTTNLAAYDAYLRGLAFLGLSNRYSPSARRSSVTALERAAALDPQFAAAHARLAVAYVYEHTFGGDTGALRKAEASAARAMTLDSSLSESRLARGIYLLMAGREDDARRTLEAAARLAPADAEVATWLGFTRERLGRLEDALASYERAARLDPRSETAVGLLAGAYSKLSRYDEAIRTRERQIALNVSSPLLSTSQAEDYLLWRADTAAARQVLLEVDARQAFDDLTWLPSPWAGRAIWLGVVPPAVLAAKDTLTLAGYRRCDWGRPEYFHLMKARHFALTGRPRRARAHADAIIALLEPALQDGDGPGSSVLDQFLAQRPTLAEAYAYASRAADAARAIDAYVEGTRRGPMPNRPTRLPLALVSAAYVDVLIGRRDVAVARLAEALRLHGGTGISRPLLRADPSWAPLRGHPGFERLMAGGSP